MRVSVGRVIGWTLTRVARPCRKSAAARTRHWLLANRIGRFKRTGDPTTLTRRLLRYLILDFRMGAGPLPDKDFLRYFSARLRRAMSSIEASRAPCAYASCKTDEAHHPPAARLRTPTCGIP